MPEKSVNVLVATHPRAGTHFCINSLCLNVRGAVFPLLRKQYPSLERLVLNHDNAYTREWERYVFETPAPVKIFKTHLTPSDIARLRGTPGLMDERSTRLFNHVYDTSTPLCVFRDGRDVLVSWYHYLLHSGGGLPTDLPARLQQCSFSSFLRMPNLYFPPVRGFGAADRNRAAYWNNHVRQWLRQEDTVSIKYESLHASFAQTVAEMTSPLGLTPSLRSNLSRPMLVSSAGKSLGTRFTRVLRRAGLAIYRRARRGVSPPSPAYARKGIVGDWRNVFSQADLDFFLEQAGDAMTELNYLDADREKTSGDHPC